MRNRVLLVLACICLLLIGASAEAQRQSAAPKVEIIPFTQSAVVAGEGTTPLVRIDGAAVYGLVVGGEGALSFGPEFRTNDIYALEVKVTWRRIPDGLHLLQLRYITPEEQVYEVTTTPFITRNRARRSVAAASLATYLKDVSHAVPVATAITTPSSGVEIWGELPTAGTWAQRLPGNWKVEVLLDNQPTVYDTISFTLTP